MVHRTYRYFTEVNTSNKSCNVKEVLTKASKREERKTKMAQRVHPYARGVDRR